MRLGLNRFLIRTLDEPRCHPSEGWDPPSAHGGFPTKTLGNDINKKILLFLISLFFGSVSSTVFAAALCHPNAKDPSPLLKAVKKYVAEKKGWKRDQFRLEFKKEESKNQNYNRVWVISNQDKIGNQKESFELDVDYNCKVIKELRFQ